MGEVVILDTETTLDIPAERVLQAAIETDLDKVLVVGVEKDGTLYVAASGSSIGDNLLLMERAKRLMLEQIED